MQVRTPLPGRTTWYRLCLQIQCEYGESPTVSIPLPSAVRVVLPVSCTVNIDTPTVQFGQIDASVASGQLMRVQQSTITTSCTSVDDGGSGTNRMSVTLSAQGTVGDVSNSLALRDASNTVKMANIFGLIGNRPAGQCTPTSTTSTS